MAFNFLQANLFHCRKYIINILLSQILGITYLNFCFVASTKFMHTLLIVDEVCIIKNIYLLSPKFIVSCGLKLVHYKIN